MKGIDGVIAVSLASTLLLSDICAANDVAKEAASRMIFIGCPIYRDTDAGRKSGCWLVTNPADGTQYDVTSGRIKPMLGRQVLVEGIAIAEGRGQCGATVLEPVDVSVLPTECARYLIPAEGLPGRRFVLPANVLQPSSVPRTLPPPPYEPREYTIQFELNSDFLVYQYAELILESASLYAKASKPQRVTITGYAATLGVDVSGQQVREQIDIAEARARMVALAFERLGVRREVLDLRWLPEPNDAAVAADGLTEAAKRRVTIRIEP
jgi:outer membrane protein OmpA-like peptidoglycan-associated protein